jgi:hypothetical protein
MLSSSISKSTSLVSNPSELIVALDDTAVRPRFMMLDQDVAQMYGLLQNNPARCNGLRSITPCVPDR